MAYKKHASVKEVANLPASATLVEKVELSLCGRKFTQSHFEWNPADHYWTEIWKSRDSKSLLWLASLAEEHKQRQAQLPQGYRNWIENDCLPLRSSNANERIPRVLTAEQEAILDEIYPTAPRVCAIDPNNGEELKRAVLREFLRSIASVLLENCITGKHPELAAGLLFSREPIPVRETSIPWLEKCMNGEVYSEVCRGDLARKSRLSFLIEAFELMTAPSLIAQNKLRRRIFYS
jgi:hypothetical protein